jgi:glycerol 3-phosphatase-2
MAGVLAGQGRWGNVRTVACDLDGVVYIDGEAIPGSGAALESLRNSGMRILFVTNNSNKTPRTVAESVAALTGFEIDARDVITSGRVTASELKGKADRVLIVGGMELSETFSRAGFKVVEDRTVADAVVVGLDRGFTYDALAEATLAIRAGALFYATNTDTTYPTAAGLKPGGGAIVAALVAATGVDPVVCGKPHGPMRAAVRSQARRGDVLVVGDRLDTDIALGKAEGWATALVLSGVTARDAPIPPYFQPDLVVDSLAALAELLLG